MSAPPDEPTRLDQLRLYRVLDTAAERAFDGLTRLAASICETPIALISLVDEHRQWFKSKVGLDVDETPRTVAFCAHAIESRHSPFVVEDASVDGRFSANPLVVGEPRIRFYAGAPLVVASGAALGTLCVIDHRPRQLRPLQVQALETLRDAVVSLLELRRLRTEMESVASLLPVCAWCRSVRDDTGAWIPPSLFLERGTRVTHSICPECLATERAKN